MKKADKQRAADRKLAALFAATSALPERDALFVESVLGRIRRRERLRWLILGGCGLIAAIFAIPALWELGVTVSSVDMSMLDRLSVWLYQAPGIAADLLRSAARSVTFWAAAALAITIAPLLRWLAD